MRIRTRGRMARRIRSLARRARARARGEGEGRGAIDLIGGLEAVPTIAEIHH